jgi:hypothetical protein
MEVHLPGDSDAPARYYGLRNLASGNAIVLLNQTLNLDAESLAEGRCSLSAFRRVLPCD